ncbi:hypothetical protein AK830_g11373 [Neonectria ditissima]|uniref:Uncharacterized protein n=1 Tax=Neonectria ditissima TaxID=78410 RepID=A0A0P7ARC8_9HYPO|nr:hypothetical protein AK830_g11373 [Neonectria ditissima]
MESLDGMLMVPPDRGQILGRAVWKMRYVVVGRRTFSTGGQQGNSSPSYSHLVTSSRNNSLTPKSTAKTPTDESCLFIYKHKEDTEPSQQWPLSCITDCQVQMVAHRKQGPVLPTLVITMSDRERKRRSSRAAGLISSSKETSANTMWFRTPQDDHHPSLHEWARFILSRKSPMSPGPESPMSPQFTNPFAPRSRDQADYFSRPNSGNQPGRSDTRALQHKSSANTHSTGTRDRPLTFSSESLSLRSKRSDVSSPSSSNYPLQNMAYPIPGQHYTTVLPTDLPSPINTTGDYQGEFIEGWTAAQGRSSTMSSPIRGRDSISSQTPQPSITATDSSSPPGPRETILDRAFQLRCIPGSEQEVPGEEKLSSLARFEALMREADQRRKQREAAERAQQMTIRSAFEASDSSDEAQDRGDSDDSDEDAYGRIPDRRGPAAIPPTAQRALQFVAGRREPAQPQTAIRPPTSRTPVNTRSDAAIAAIRAPPMRPHTANAKSRPSPSQRIQSTSQLAAAMASGDMSASSSRPSNKPSEEAIPRPNGDKRLSTSSTKRLSFTEFTKRLSSTSSLLLVQTNASGGSSRGSSEIDVQPSPVPRGTLNPRGTGPPPRDRERDENDRRCGWRNSVVGVIGTEGGFL